MKDITKFKTGETVVITNVGHQGNFARRLAEMGVITGVTVKIVKNDHFNPLILKILDSRLAIGYKEAKEIYAKK